MKGSLRWATSGLYRPSFLSHSFLKPRRLPFSPFLGAMLAVHVPSYSRWCPWLWKGDWWWALRREVWEAGGFARGAVGKSHCTVRCIPEARQCKGLSWCWCSCLHPNQGSVALGNISNAAVSPSVLGSSSASETRQRSCCSSICLVLGFNSKLWKKTRLFWWEELSGYRNEWCLLQTHGVCSK